MATFNEQVERAWDEWEAMTGDRAGDPDAFVAWALEHRKIAPRPQDVRKILRGQVVDALRQLMRTDEDGITYRAKQCIRTYDEGLQLSLWFDTDRATRSLMAKATAQKRKSIVDDCYRAKCDVDHFNNTHPDEEPINLVLDFTDDVAELEAEEAEAKDKGKKSA